MKPPRPAPHSASAATRLLRSWFAIVIGLYPALVVTTAGIALVIGISSGSLPTLAAMLVAVTLYALVLAIPVAVISALLALPLLAFQRFIVGPKPPHLRLGYIAVILYGPALLALFQHGWEPSAWVVVAPYEVTVLIATLIYVRLADPLELFAAEG